MVVALQTSITNIYSEEKPAVNINAEPGLVNRVSFDAMFIHGENPGIRL